MGGGGVEGSRRRGLLFGTLLFVFATVIIIIMRSLQTSHRQPNAMNVRAADGAQKIRKKPKWQIISSSVCVPTAYIGIIKAVYGIGTCMKMCTN